MESIYKKIDELQRTILEPYQRMLSAQAFISYQKCASLIAQEIAPSFEHLSKLINQSATIELPGVYKAVQDFADRLAENSYEKLVESIYTILDTSLFSSLSDNIIIHDDYVELDEKAVETLDPYADLRIDKSADTDHPTNHPAPAKCRMTCAEFISILITILFGIAGLLMDYSQGRNDSIAQQQQWQIENKQQEEANYLKHLETVQNAEIIDLLKELLETQETAPVNPSVPDQAGESLDYAQESANHTLSPADDDQTVPDESCTPDTDEQ